MATGVASWSQTAATNAAADSNVNMAEGMAPAQVNDGVRALMASVAKWRDDLAGITTGGSSTAYTVTSNQGFASLAALDGRRITIIPHASSGGAPTLVVDGLTAQKLRLQTGVDAPPGAFVLGSSYEVRYNNSATEFIACQALGTAVPAGLVAPFAGSAAPSGWYLCAGQTVSRSLNAALFTAISTTFGVGDGSTTFGLPDLRGRVIAGVDNMNGGAANLLQASTTISTTIGLTAATVASATNIAAGMTVVSANVPAGTTVQSITGTAVTLSGAATGTAAGTAARFSAVADAQVVGSIGGATSRALSQSEIPTGLFTLTDPGHFHSIGTGSDNLSSGTFEHATNNAGPTNTSTNTTGITLTDHAGGAAHALVQPTMTLNYIIKA